MTTVADLIGADGAHGDPGMLQASAASIERTGEDVVRLQSKLAAIDGAQWQGQARVRYDKLRDQTVSGDLAPIPPAYQAAAEALRRYAHRLSDVQARARALAAELSQAQARVGTHHRDAVLADGATQAAKVATIATTLSPAARVATELVYREAKQHRARMHAQLAESQRQVTRLRARGEELRAELDHAAAECAAQAGGLNPPSMQITAGAAAAVTAIGAIPGKAIGARRPSGGNGRRGTPRFLPRTDPGPTDALRQQWNTTPGGPDARGFAAKHDKERVDYDGLYGAQCVDVFTTYNRDVVHGPFYSCEGAWQLYGLYGGPGKKYAQIPASATPLEGDVAIYGQSMGGGYGHVAIVLADKGNQIEVFHQNYPRGSAAHYDVIPKTGLIGYLRPQA